MDFSVIERAELTQQDFADIVGISRVAMGKIIANGNFVRTVRALEYLEKLVQAGTLPRGYSRNDKANRAALVTALKEKLAAKAV